MDGSSSENKVRKFERMAVYSNTKRQRIIHFVYLCISATIVYFFSVVFSLSKDQIIFEAYIWGKKIVSYDLFPSSVQQNWYNVTVMFYQTLHT